MREIKFRAWHKKENKMLDWFILCQSAFNRGETHLMYDIFTSPSFEDCGFVLMQFTGLKDKNGKDVYEGDVLRYVSKNPFSLGEARKVRVYYIEAHFWCNGSGIGIYLGELLSNEKCEVIGNIHENPELLNQI